jgi:hypothetical protein
MLNAPEMVGRFQKHVAPNGDVVFKEIRGENHYYWSEVKPNSSSEGGYSYIQTSGLTGVSTASKFLDGDPGGLMHWAAERDQDGIARTVSADMEAGYSLDWLCSQETIKARLYAEEATWEHERNRRADQGTNVHHEAVWKLATGEDASLADVSEAERGFARGVFRSFLDLGLRGKVRYAEQLTVDFTKTPKIAGTFDLLAEDVETERLLPRLINIKQVPAEIAERPTLRLLADYKTRDGAGKVRKSDHLQLQGYEQCNLACGIGASNGRVVIIVLPDGSYELYWGEATEGQWNAAVNACGQSKPLTKRVEALSKAAKTAREAVVPV